MSWLRPARAQPSAAPARSDRLKLVVFMGHHKVGSSSLQQFLAQNWLPLASAGILYPAVEAQGLARNLAEALAGSRSSEARSVNVREPHNALAFKLIAECAGAAVPEWHPMLPAVAQMKRIVNQQVEALRPHTVVICSEVLSHLGALPPQGLERLTGLCPGAEVHILCTLRRPDAYLVSWHSQRLKFGHRVAALRDDALAQYGDTIHFDYRLMLEAWFAALPDAEFHLRPYDDVLAAGGSIPDFLATAGITPPPGLEMPDDSNPSLPAALMEFARRANHELDPEAAGLVRKALIGARRAPGLAANRDVEMFGQPLRERMLERFAPIDAWLAERMGRQSFFDDLESLGQTRPLDERDAARQGLELLLAPAQRVKLRPRVATFLRDLQQQQTSAADAARTD